MGVLGCGYGFCAFLLGFSSQGRIQNGWGPQGLMRSPELPSSLECQNSVSALRKGVKIRVVGVRPGLGLLQW